MGQASARPGATFCATPGTSRRSPITRRAPSKRAESLPSDLPSVSASPFNLLQYSLRHWARCMHSRAGTAILHRVKCPLFFTLEEPLSLLLLCKKGTNLIVRTSAATPYGGAPPPVVTERASEFELVLDKNVLRSRLDRGRRSPLRERQESCPTLRLLPARKFAHARCEGGSGAALAFDPA